MRRKSVSGSKRDHSGLISKRAWLVRKCAKVASLASVSAGRLGSYCGGLKGALSSFVVGERCCACGLKLRG